MKYKKRLERLEARQRSHDAFVSKVGMPRAKGYRRPGSQKK